MLCVAVAADVPADYTPHVTTTPLCAGSAAQHMPGGLPRTTPARTARVPAAAAAGTPVRTLKVPFCGAEVRCVPNRPPPAFFGGAGGARRRVPALAPRCSQALDAHFKVMTMLLNISYSSSLFI